MKQGKLAESAQWILGLPEHSTLLLPTTARAHPVIQAALGQRPDLGVLVIPTDPPPSPWGSPFR